MFHFLQECVPVRSHRSHCSFLAFVQKGNHSVGAHMPGPGLDLIECKLKKILLKEKTAHKYVYEKGKKTLITQCLGQASAYLRELKSPVRQQRCDPIGTFGQVAVELG